MNLLYLSAPGGGLDTNVRLLGPALVQAGHQVALLYIHFAGENGHPPAETWHGCRILHATLGDWHYYAHRALLGRSALPRVLRGYEHALAMRGAIRAYHRHEGLDLVELPEAHVPRRLLGGLPYVMRLHSAGWAWRQILCEGWDLADRHAVAAEARTLRGATGITAPSRAYAGYVERACRLKRRPIEIIPYPVDTGRFAPLPGAANAREHILYVGRVERRKGADGLLDALERVWFKHPTCQAIFVGRVSEDMADRVAAAPQQARFLGVVPHADLVTWYQRARLVVVPSLWDNSPNVAYEAMACGAPVVASRVGGIPELVDDGDTGWLVPPRDPQALADRILALLGDPARAARMGQRGREKAVAGYSLDRIAAQTIQFYERALWAG